jgi:competence protein ComEC
MGRRDLRHAATGQIVASRRIDGRAGVLALADDPRPAAPLFPGAATGLRVRAAFAAAGRASLPAGRVVLGVPILFSAGALAFLLAPAEPNLNATLVLACICLTALWVARTRPVAALVAVAALAFVAGFLAGALRVANFDHPVLTAPVTIELTGRIERFETRERSNRMILLVPAGADGAWPPVPARVRIVLRKGAVLAPGATVALKARLEPPPPASIPGGYDPARDLWFQKIGAVGLAAGTVRVLAPPAPLSLAAPAAWIADVRTRLSAAIRSAVPGDAGVLADALVTGRRDGLSASADLAFNVSSLAHLLSISGYHMALVAGVMFFVVRATLALVPGFALRFDLKRVAAVSAFAATLVYLGLSGAEVATQRAFIMTGVALAGVMIGRATLTFRALGLAVIVIVAIAPETIAQASFQMSFAATLALVALFEARDRGRIGPAGQGRLAGLAAFGLTHLGLAVATSLVASLATAPFVMAHFQRVSTFGVIANLVATPLMSLWTMPLALLGLAATPFGYGPPVWRLMGMGTQATLDWASLVASWPHASLSVAPLAAWFLPVATLALGLMCLLSGLARLAGLALAIAVVGVAWRAPSPDLLVAADGRTVAVRSADGGLSILSRHPDPTVARAWQRMEADTRPLKNGQIGEGWLCDPGTCIAVLPDGRLVAHVVAPADLQPACVTAAVVVAPWLDLDACAAPIRFDRVDLATAGAATIRFDATGPVIRRADDGTGRRPWHRPAVEKPAATPGTPASEDPLTAAD